VHDRTQRSYPQSPTVCASRVHSTQPMRSEIQLSSLYGEMHHRCSTGRGTEVSQRVTGECSMIVNCLSSRQGSAHSAALHWVHQIHCLVELSSLEWEDFEVRRCHDKRKRARSHGCDRLSLVGFELKFKVSNLFFMRTANYLSIFDKSDSRIHFSEVTGFSRICVRIIINGLVVMMVYVIYSLLNRPPPDTSIFMSVRTWGFHRFLAISQVFEATR
jgi:hypothetical protein